MCSLLADERKTICLNMIVKNESHVIRRCLASVKPLIDYWVIVDTGSTDKTQDIIKEFMKDIPGKLYQRPWVNFAHNRNEALELAKNTSDYVLFIDADEQLVIAENYINLNLDKDFYYITSEFSGMKYNRIQLINNHLDWKWQGVLHETVESPQIKSFDVLKGITNFINTDGARSKDPQKFYKDAALLEEALKKEPNNSRYVFYLAQSYKDAGEYLLAIQNYEKRIAMGGWEQEIFWSKYQIGLLQESLQMSPEIFTKSYYDAFHFSPFRAEPLYRLANYHRRNGNYAAGYALSCLALTLSPSFNHLFIEQWIYDYGLLLESSICSYWIGKYNESERDCLVLLANQRLLPEMRECVENNLKWVYTKIPPTQLKTTPHSCK